MGNQLPVLRASDLTRHPRRMPEEDYAKSLNFEMYRAPRNTKWCVDMKAEPGWQDKYKRLADRMAELEFRVEKPVEKVDEHYHYQTFQPETVRFCVSGYIRPP